MNRFGAIAFQPRRSSPNDLLLSPESGWEKSASIEQSRTSTFFDGFVIFGGLRVYWYASVSMRKSGNSLFTSAATALHSRIHGPDSEPSSFTTAWQSPHWHAPTL